MQGINSISGLSQKKNVTKKQEDTPFVDQCPVHPLDVGDLKNVEVEFLGTNTSVLQPMDQNIIRSPKQKICRRLLLILLRGMKSNEHSQKYSLLDAVEMLHQHGAIPQESTAFLQKLHSVQKQLQWTKLIQWSWWWWWWGWWRWWWWSRLWSNNQVKSYFSTTVGEFYKAVDALPAHEKQNVEHLCNLRGWTADEDRVTLTTANCFPHSYGQGTAGELQSFPTRCIWYPTALCQKPVQSTRLDPVFLDNIPQQFWQIVYIIDSKYLKLLNFLNIVTLHLIMYIQITMKEKW